MMNTVEAREWMEENIGDNWSDVEFHEGTASNGEEWVEMTLSKKEWNGEITVTYWAGHDDFEICGSPYGCRCLQESNKTAVIKEVQNRIADFDDYAEEETREVENNYISPDNREYGSIAVAW